jgi:hypothetical protein
LADRTHATKKKRKKVNQRSTERRKERDADLEMNDQ